MAQGSAKTDRGDSSRRATAPARIASGDCRACTGRLRPPHEIPRTAARRASLEACVYRAVVVGLVCPNSSWTALKAPSRSPPWLGLLC
jgi:hypothetical protein